MKNWHEFLREVAIVYLVVTIMYAVMGWQMAPTVIMW